MLESVQRGPKDLKRSKRSSSKRSLRLQLRKDEQKNTIRTLRYSDPVVNVRDLLLKYGGSFNLMAQDWSKLDRELLSLKEERYLASLMKPFKVLSSLLLLLLLSSSFKLNQTLIWALRESVYSTWIVYWKIESNIWSWNAFTAVMHHEYPCSHRSGRLG